MFSKLSVAMLLLTALLPITSCARSIPIERRDFILAKPHGWIELTVVDTSIPNVKIKNDDKIIWSKPTTCYISAKSNSEVFLDQNVFPDGPQPPYSVNSGFRFPIPVGTQNLTISYSGCRINEESELITLENTSDLTVNQNMIYEFNLVNDSFSFIQEKQSDEVTLKQIYDAVREKSHN